jgi:hypothetical protein
MSSRQRFFVSLVVVALAVAALASGPTARWSAARAASPASGTMAGDGSSGLKLTWTGTPANNANPTAAEADCEEGVNCDTFTLNVTGTPTQWAGKVLQIRIDWTLPALDYALAVHKDSNSGPLVGYSDNPINSPRNWERSQIEPALTGPGTYTVHVIYFNTTVLDPYKGSVTLGYKAFPTPPPASTASAPRFFNYTPPAGLGTDAGEPSIGVSWKTDRAFFQSYTSVLRATFDDSSSPARVTWEDKSAPNAVASLDPILYTDGPTGRTFTSQLAGKASLMAYSDDDGETWTPSQGSGINSGVDHQTIGGGPFAAPLTRAAGQGLYEHAVYYCSQDTADALCAVSLDGGLTFGPAVPIYTQLDCGGLHGHVKVAPDGTAYVPNRGCGGAQGLAVSENNGMTWTVRKVPASMEGETDPSVGIGADGTVYFAYANGDGRAFVAVSRDKGQKWTDIQDVGFSQGVYNSAFPAAVAGDGDRASVFFLGTPKVGYGGYGGDPAAFDGTWYGYVSTTYDGGKTWTTVNATAGDPIQRGPICTLGPLGCEGKTRNLLDFNDLTVDRMGRVLAAYADGCVSAECIRGDDRNGDGRLDARDNDGTAVATIIRLAGGRGLFSRFDSQLAQAAASAPLVTATLKGQAASVSWPAPDGGGSAITGYKVYRGVGNDAAALVATLDASTRAYADAASGTNVYYQVSAVNAAGEGVRSPKTYAAAAASPCVAPGVRVLTDYTKDTLDQSAQHDVEWVNVGEERGDDGAEKLVLRMKVADLSGPLTLGTTWQVFFTGADGRGYFAHMNVPVGGGPRFRYGTFTMLDDGTEDTETVVGNLDAGSGIDPSSNTITLVLDKGKVGGPAAGSRLSGFFVRVVVGAVVPENANYPSPSPAVNYTLAGSCL